jgi:hypothetical protein
MDKSLHTHRLYMSWAGYLHYFGRVTFVWVILVYHLHALIILTCSTTSFSYRNTCVCYFPCEGPNFADFSLFRRFRQFFLFSLYFWLTVGFILLCFPGPSETVRESNFFFWPGMYFRTGQVIFVLEWLKGEFLSILALLCVWTKSLMCNDAVNRDSTFRVKLEDSACESEEFQVPCQPFGRCVIPSGRPSVYCSTRPNDVSFRPDIIQTSSICLDNVLLPSGHLHRIEMLLCQLSPSWRFSSTSRHLSVLERFTDSFQVPRKGRLINRPDVFPSWSGRTRIRYGNCVLKFSRPDAPAPWSGRAKPVMEITCSERASVRTIELSRPDDVLIQERFLRENFEKSCRTIVRHGPPSGRLPGIFCLTPSL